MTGRWVSIQESTYMFECSCLPCKQHQDGNQFWYSALSVAAALDSFLAEHNEGTPNYKVFQMELREISTQAR